MQSRLRRQLSETDAAQAWRGANLPGCQDSPHAIDKLLHAIRLLNEETPGEIALQLLARISREHDERQPARRERAGRRTRADAPQIGVENRRVEVSAFDDLQRGLELAGKA